MLITFDDVREYIQVRDKFDKLDKVKHHDWLARHLYRLAKLVTAAERDDD